MTSRIAIIPARGNSKRIKNKNIKIFNGKPIIKYSIENSRKCKLFSRIHVSTESKKISKIVGDKYIDFFRPKKLSRDKTPTFDVLKFVVNKYIENQIKFDEIWCINACSPLIKISDLKKASKALKNNPKNIIISVSSYNVPVEWSFKKNKNNKLKPLFPGAYNKNSQNFKKKYFDTGDFICMNYKMFQNINHKTNLDMLYHGIEIEKFRSVDIDEIEDWKIAELFHKGLKI
jgi:pseudaminic acid cytidylyltransferase